MIEKEIAKRLDECEYCNEDRIKWIEGQPKTVAEYAKENGVVFVFGASDDLFELRGAIDDEVEAYDDTRVLLDQSGLVHNKCGNDKCPYFADISVHAMAYITALWCEGDEYSWTYNTNIAHEEFDVLEDGKKYCRGIVFTMKTLAFMHRNEAVNRNGGT